MTFRRFVPTLALLAALSPVWTPVLAGGSQVRCVPGEDEDCREIYREILDRVRPGEDGENSPRAFLLGRMDPVASGYLGIFMTELTEELRRHFGAPDDEGVLVARVEPDSPADRAGIKVGDVVTRLDGEPVLQSHDVMSVVREATAGDLLQVELVRGGRPMTLEAELEERERSRWGLHQNLPLLRLEPGSSYSFDFQPEELQRRIEDGLKVWRDALGRRPESSLTPDAMRERMRALEERLRRLEEELEHSQP